MACEQELKYNMKPFNGDNYLVWKYRLRAIIEQKDALAVLDEEQAEDITDQWRKWERFAKGKIIQHLDKPLLGEIPENATVRQISQH